MSVLAMLHESSAIAGYGMLGGFLACVGAFLTYLKHTTHEERDARKDREGRDREERTARDERERYEREQTIASFTAAMDRNVQAIKDSQELNRQEHARIVGILDSCELRARTAPAPAPDPSN